MSISDTGADTLPRRGPWKVQTLDSGRKAPRPVSDASDQMLNETAGEKLSAARAAIGLGTSRVPWGCALAAVARASRRK